MVIWSSPNKMPPAAASAEPTANVARMMRSVSIPIRRAASMFVDTARMALPVQVR